MILCISSVVGAFCTSFGLDWMEQKRPEGTSTFIVGSVFFMVFFITATIPYVIYIKSLSYFMRRKVQSLLKKQFQKLSNKQRFLIIWSFLVGILNLMTLMIRIFMTYWTRRHLTPDIDTETIFMQSLMLVITLIDWVTPYSLVYCYYYITVSKKEETPK